MAYPSLCGMGTPSLEPGARGRIPTLTTPHPGATSQNAEEAPQGQDEEQPLRLGSYSSGQGCGMEADAIPRAGNVTRHFQLHFHLPVTAYSNSFKCGRNAEENKK